jgi:hypothetical protein
MPKPASSGSSFLDEWMAKRKENIVSPTPVAATSKPIQNSPPPKKPVPDKPQQPKESPTLEASINKGQGHDGEFKIDREIDPAKHQSQIVHIDKEGNLSFGE